MQQPAISLNGASNQENDVLCAVQLLRRYSRCRKADAGVPHSDHVTLLESFRHRHESTIAQTCGHRYRIKATLAHYIYRGLLIL